MRKLLLAMAVLGTLLPLLEGTPLQDNSRENGRLESGEKLCKGQGNTTVGTRGEADKPPCGAYNTKCGSGASPPCCEQGQDCDTKNGVCKCFLTPDKHCGLLCGQYREQPCCVTAVNSNGLCQCCLYNQICDPSKGCDCGANHCNVMCEKDPGGGAFGCCVGTECKCCKKGHTCTATGCKLPCDAATCQNICKGTCDTATATCNSNCATNEICKDGQCQPKCDDTCTSANCKSCVNEVCVTSCPPSECIGGTCSTTPCDQAACIKSCDGTCNLSTNHCNSGCPGTCVSGKCPCDDAKCKQSCGICVSGSCQSPQCPAGTSCNPTSGHCECQRAGEGLCCKEGGTCVCCNQMQSCDPLVPSCKCDPTKCTATSCLQCGSDRVTCEAITCGPCETCTFGNGCQSTCDATQKCDGTKCVDKCDGVVCSTEDKCVAGVCQCDPIQCLPGFSCDESGLGCVCTAADCAAFCSGKGEPCCTPALDACSCCPNGRSCKAKALHRDPAWSGNVSHHSWEKTGTCQDSCDEAVCKSRCGTCDLDSGCVIPTCDFGLECDAKSGTCICTADSCGSKCNPSKGETACCTADGKTCNCCPTGSNCAPGGQGLRWRGRDNFASGNSSSVERAGICTDPCAGVTCYNPGESCQDGLCKCDDQECGRDCISAGKLSDCCDEDGNCGCRSGIIACQ